MKFLFITVFFILLIVQCGQQNISNKEVAKKYFNARNSVAFKEVKKLINDSLTIVEGDYIMPYSQESYYEVFRWDSVFQTSYNIIDLQEKDEQIIVSIELTSIRNKFLKNDLMECKFKLSFSSGRISKIESLDCANADWEIWQKSVNALVDWISINHPELNGFINDMTMNGANNYLKAINLYESNENEF